MNACGGLDIRNQYEFPVIMRLMISVFVNHVLGQSVNHVPLDRTPPPTKERVNCFCKFLFSEKLFYSSIFRRTRSITPGIPPMALIVRVYGFSGMPQGLKSDIMRSQQKSADRPDITDRRIFPRLSLLSISITRIIPEEIRRIKSRFIISPLNFMLVPINKCILKP